MAQQAELETLEKTYTGETARRIVYRENTEESDNEMEKNFRKKLPNAESNTKRLFQQSFSRENEAFETMYEIQKMEKMNEITREKEAQEMKKMQIKLEELEEDNTQEMPEYKIDLEEISSDEGEAYMFTLPTAEEENQIQRK